MRKSHLFLTVVLFFTCIFAEIPPEIPDSPLGLIYFPCNFQNLGPSYENFWKALSNILEMHGYNVAPAQQTRGGPPGTPGPLLPDLLFYLNDGSRGYICIYTHGIIQNGIGWLSVEFYLTENEAEQRAQELAQEYNAWGDVGFSQTPEGSWAVVVSSRFLQNNVNNLLPHSVVFIDACHSASLLGNPSILDAFLNIGAQVGFGWITAVGGARVQAPISIFYRMGGANYNGPLEPVIQDELRNKSAMEAEIEYMCDLLTCQGNQDMKMYNSPRIVGLEIKQAGKLVYQYHFDQQSYYPYEWEYPGDLSGCPKNPATVGNYILEFQILFSSPMDPNKAHIAIMPEQGNFAIPVNGNFGKCIFNNDWFIGACDFSEWQGGENAIVSVDAEDAFEGDINAKLDINGDGNSDGTDTNHKFKVELPPQVIFTDPSDGASEVDVYKNITITFNKEMDQSSVNSGTVQFSPALVGGFLISRRGEGNRWV